ncbi:DNA-3-methyladenine glycosylase 2 family protein [Caulobacter sp. HMWF009]|nr:DNA-3-methyladenine glycosylase 2 family protein [Caulobacter sp. HMWF009]PTT12374.1 DNA-3-methyladenine glycosylase 2 family protein [Caulobacter sp. HMWF025]
MSPEEIRSARDALVRLDPALARIEAVTPDFDWRVREPGFAGLLKLMVEQQVSLASAAAIWARVERGLGEVTPAAVLALSDAELQGLGLSRPKVRYARAIAEAQVSGLCDLQQIGRLDDQAATAALMTITGIGRWTAETYLMFCEGRLDVFPGGDIALQEAMRWVDGAGARPSQVEAYQRAAAWAPHRSAAAHLLWRCYGAVKRREIPPF